MRPQKPVNDAPRKSPSDGDLLAMFIVLWEDPTTGLPAINDVEAAKKMTSKEIIKLFRATHNIDHCPILRTWGGPDHPTNYFPRPTADHIEKTKGDLRDAAKVKRIRREREEAEAKKNAEHEDFRRRVLEKAPEPLHERTDEQPSKKKWKRNWPKRKILTKKQFLAMISKEDKKDE
jgi:hypothetical protein